MSGTSGTSEVSERVKLGYGGGVGGKRPGVVGLMFALAFVHAWVYAFGAIVTRMDRSSAGEGWVAVRTVWHPLVAAHRGVLRSGFRALLEQATGGSSEYRHARFVLLAGDSVMYGLAGAMLWRWGKKRVVRRQERGDRRGERSKESTGEAGHGREAGWAGRLLVVVLATAFLQMLVTETFEALMLRFALSRFALGYSVVHLLWVGMHPVRTFVTRYYVVLPGTGRGSAWRVVMLRGAVLSVVDGLVCGMVVAGVYWWRKARREERADSREERVGSRW